MSDFQFGVLVAALFGIALDVRSLKRAVKDAKDELRDESERERQEVGGEVGEDEHRVAE